MKASGIHHVGIVVTDVDAAKEFYIGRLGFAERDDRPDFPFGGAWLQVGDQQLHLLQTADADPGGGHFALAVEDLDAVVAELRSGGLSVSDPVPVGPGRQAFVRDPSGNTVELNQPAVPA